MNQSARGPNLFLHSDAACRLLAAECYEQAQRAREQEEQDAYLNWMHLVLDFLELAERIREAGPA